MAVFKCASSLLVDSQGGTATPYEAIKVQLDLAENASKPAARNSSGSVECPLLADFVAEVSDDRCVAPGANVFM